MLDHEFLGDIVKIPFTHPLEAIPDILLYEFVFFLCQGRKRAVLRIVGGGRRQSAWFG